MDGEEAFNSVTTALEEGYRLIDTAAWYGNETECGKAIQAFLKNSSISRSEIYYTTKLRSNQGYAATKKAIKSSLDKCGLGYIDLYLVHSPLGGAQARLDSWEAILDAQKNGKIKSVGVSNYGVAHIQEMVDSGLPLPVINQIDLHPFMSREAIVEICRKHDIVLQAWAPLVRGEKFGDPTVQALAQKYSKTPAQVLLRYSLQKGYIPLPKSVKQERIKANKDIYDFELSQEEMDKLYALDEYLVTDWDVVDAE
ncbi:hypothetical protein M408DRAFT_330833 [Serendipita vermifera MAFF 305830]|uniref:NADP-dependent oxidoreductase domain-containing protein n=1 Tax=Serendipita vermifera MAFF 305830 TaxID=933852 RepID=A0A0C3B1J7_SERVB|nr:hypothetical protein M408DRAFT_330833 [Serendipita vermifera MAFF 305830]